MCRVTLTWAKDRICFNTRFRLHIFIVQTKGRSVYQVYREVYVEDINVMEKYEES